VKRKLTGNNLIVSRNFGMMKTLLIVSLCSICHLSFGQGMDFGTTEVEQPAPKTEEVPEPRSKFKDNFFLGGNFGFQFGSVTFIDVSPLAGYRVLKNGAVGLGITYQYLDWETRGGSYSTHTYGGRVFARYIIWKGIMAHAEFEMLNLDCFDEDYYRLNGELRVAREWIPGALFGGGYYQRVGGRAGITALVLFNALQSDCTPYSNPVIRLGFNIGI
jgi:hypothetical protein